MRVRFGPGLAVAACAVLCLVAVVAVRTCQTQVPTFVAGLDQQFLYHPDPATDGDWLHLVFGGGGSQADLQQQKLVTWPYADPVTGRTLLLPAEPVTLRGEPDVVRLFNQFRCRDEHDIFVDVGLHSGFYSLLARMRGCQVIAFELQPSCIELFRLAERMNMVQPPTPVVHRPVAETPGRPFDLSSQGVRKCEGMFSLFWQGSTHFDTVSLDQALFPVLRGGTRIGLLKIDIEGFEPWAVLGGRRLLEARQVDALIVESTWWPNVMWPIHKAYSLLAMVFEYGYTVRCIGPGAVWDAEFVDAATWMQFGTARVAMMHVSSTDARYVSTCSDFLICLAPCRFSAPDTHPTAAVNTQ
jgi:FkbM family methyltransferase